MEILRHKEVWWNITPFKYSVNILKSKTRI